MRPGATRGVTRLLRYERPSGRWETLGQIEASDGTKCYRPHDIFIHAGRVFVAETDVPDRSGFIWEVELPEKDEG